MKALGLSDKLALFLAAKFHHQLKASLTNNLNSFLFFIQRCVLFTTSTNNNKRKVDPHTCKGHDACMEAGPH